MTECEVRVMLVGYFGPGALESSYRWAFQQLGCQVKIFDISASIEHYCRLGRMGRLFNKFVPVEPWIRKANRDMVLESQSFKPDVLLVFGQNQVRSGALAQLIVMCKASTVLIWADTLINLNETIIDSLPIYDLIATYGQNTVTHFKNLAARRVEWIPLAGDPSMYTSDISSKADRTNFDADVSFVGQWRPEREKVLNLLLAELPEYEIKIWGPDWGRRCRGKHDILRAWQGRPLYGSEFAKAIRGSKINLNIIDPTNYPAAQMRFFEIPCAGGLQVCSPCPEMEDEFKHGDTVYYYRTLKDLPDLMRSLLSDDSLRKRVAQKAHEKVLNEHTYKHRAQQILRLLI